ncbi:MAG: efflux RND transporter periplasmic adaptor subunit [Methylotenera sp.]|nr:efflux RND transporter periplasmic adaptor subunit [Methylotenera sp.]
MNSELPKENTQQQIREKPIATSNKNPRSWIKIAIALLVVFSVSAYLSRNLILGKPVDAYPATIGELVQTVVASGRVMTPQRITIAAETTGRVNEIPVSEGQTVKRGQLLIQLNDQDERASLAQATAAVSQARAKLRQLREVALPAASQSLKQAQTNVEQARKQYERTRDLQARGFISQAQLDEAKRNYDVISSQVNAARLQVETNRSDGSDLAVASATVAQANASLHLAQVKLNEDAILAPADGTLISRSVEPGDIVQPGKELMVLAADGETQILVQLDEKNLAKLALGQKVLGSADAYADQRFDAVVSYINPGIDATRGAVEVKMTVAKPPAYLRQDMTVSVDIETARRSGALVIPTGALHDASSIAPWVLVVRNNHTVKQSVKLGLRGDNSVEVLSGLKAGEGVILTAVGIIKADMHVRANIIKTQ